MRGCHRAVPPFTFNLLCSYMNPHTALLFHVWCFFFVSFDAKIFHRTHSARPGASRGPSTRSHLHLQPSPLFYL